MTNSNEFNLCLNRGIPDQTPLYMTSESSDSMWRHYENREKCGRLFLFFKGLSSSSPYSIAGCNVIHMACGLPLGGHLFLHAQLSRACFAREGRTFTCTTSCIAHLNSFLFVCQRRSSPPRLPPDSSWFFSGLVRL